MDPTEKIRNSRNNPSAKEGLQARRRRWPSLLVVEFSNSLPSFNGIRSSKTAQSQYSRSRALESRPCATENRVSSCIRPSSLNTPPFPKLACPTCILANWIVSGFIDAGVHSCFDSARRSNRLLVRITFRPPPRFVMMTTNII